MPWGSGGSCSSTAYLPTFPPAPGIEDLELLLDTSSNTMAFELKVVLALGILYDTPGVFEVERWS